MDQSTDSARSIACLTFDSRTIFSITIIGDVLEDRLWFIMSFRKGPCNGRFRKSRMNRVSYGVRRRKRSRSKRSKKGAK